MARYTVRVELSDADWEDYETLHTEMENRGFTRTITSNNGITLQLPDAEYNYSGERTTDQVLEMTKQAAQATGKTYKVLVTKAEERKWYNLDRAD